MTVRRACGQPSVSTPTVWRPVFSDISLLTDQGGVSAQDTQDAKDAKVDSQEGQARPHRNVRPQDATLRAKATSHGARVRLSTISLLPCYHHYLYGLGACPTTAFRRTKQADLALGGPYPLNSTKNQQVFATFILRGFFGWRALPVRYCGWEETGNGFDGVGSFFLWREQDN